MNYPQELALNDGTIKKLRVLLSKEQIQKRNSELGEEISKHYSQVLKDGEVLNIVCVLNGAMIFCADLIRHLRIPLRLEFVKVASYHGTNSTHEIKLEMDLKKDPKNKHLLLIEDIIDTGLTFNFLHKHFCQKHPQSLKTVALLDKPNARVKPFKTDFFGFQITNEFVIGYGLDLDGRYREWPDIIQLIS